ncbi:MAG: orotidine 5'-phosphate decarboxylase [Candidatus Liptonbacteria bacterium RIFCSPLOWO2_01_FULL_53_13]|uniref:Orotidine-5'-phosphate decarboxylase n=1 Tax=Candidatus Liptonbacteria bacterium RIFCSPLOWO2_01_FULL_53_13 TaxID=1798651 RepID=A0A1G2CL39_9BACT|nr:MAG: orotidine 5'-phosphate decarboxylase [Candidatus Liptonbacteria bacterium RIFCSPLOWO2_01_FULL_53_13]
MNKYDTRVEKVNSLLCVGLDPDMAKIPERFHSLEFPLFEFNKYIIDATAEFVSAFKPNIAFYEVRGAKGIQELEMTIRYIQTNHPDIFTICDAKRGDVANTNEQYVAEIFDAFGFDATTVQPYFGKESLIPFLKHADKTIIVLVRTSNPGANELQDLNVDGKPLWQIVAEKVRDSWNENGNCMLMAGATYPAEIKKLRDIMDEMTFLMPGVGKQGGNLEEAIRAGLNSGKKGLIVNASRSIIYAENPAEEARKLKNDINRYR